MSELYVLIAIGVAIVVVPLIPWSKVLQFAKGTAAPDVATHGLSDCVKQVRYYLAIQDKATRERGFEACDTLDGIISEQPLLPSFFGGEES